MKFLSSLPRGVLYGLGTIVVYVGLLAAGLDPKQVAIGIAGVLLASSVYRRVHELLLPTLLAFAFAIFITTAHHYVYDAGNWYLGSMNLFPLVMWASGLVLAYDVYRWLAARIPLALLASTLLYWILLAAAEYIGYHWAGIHMAGNLPTFLGLPLLHGTPLQHLFYPTAGPLYLMLTIFLVPVATPKIFSTIALLPGRTRARGGDIPIPR